MSTVADVLRVKGDHVLMVTPEVRVLHVAQRMRQENVGAFVVSRDGRQLDGLITERDIVHGIARHGTAVVDMPASALMSHTAHSCSPRDSVRSAMAEMTRMRVRHLPVLDKGELRGIISIGDVVKACVDDAELENRVLRDAYIAHR
jgi:CBS domain-containing protein